MSPENKKPGDFPGSHKSIITALSRERGSAAAAAGRIRILKRESRAHHVRGVIDNNPVKILGGEHIDEELDPVTVEYEIALTRIFLDV